MKMRVLLHPSLVVVGILIACQSQRPEQKTQATLILEKFQKVIDEFCAESNPEVAADIY